MLFTYIKQGSFDFVPPTGNFQSPTSAPRSYEQKMRLYPELAYEYSRRNSRVYDPLTEETTTKSTELS